MNPRPLKRLAAAAGFTFAALPPASLFACAACYGASDSPLAQGMSWGILTLLGVVVSVLALVFAFFVHVGRNSARLRAGEPAQNPTDKLP